MSAAEWTAQRGQHVFGAVAVTLIRPSEEGSAANPLGIAEEAASKLNSHAALLEALEGLLALEQNFQGSVYFTHQEAAKEEQAREAALAAIRQAEPEL